MMVNKTVNEVTDEINSNYIAPHTENHSWRDPPPFTDEDVDDVRVTLSERFSFSKNIRGLTKVPVYFKKCIDSSCEIAEALIEAMYETGVYPNCLKKSKCDILPSRSIFQNTRAHAKAIEGFFATYVRLKCTGGLENMAYREQLSTTALLINEFDALARHETLYGFNCDLKKAFDRLCRELVLDAIDNNFVKNIVSSWMDRAGAPI